MNFATEFARLPRFFSRSAAERRLLLEILLTLWLVRLELWLLPFGRVTRLGKRPPAETPSSQTSSIETSRVKIARLAKTLSAVNRYVPHATCLTQALAGQRLLAAHGYPSRLRIGVRKDGARLSAHAWLEHEGTVVVGRVSNLADYRPLPGEGERL